MRRTTLIALAVLAGWVLTHPPVPARPWMPPEDPGFTGPYAENDALADVTWLGRGDMPAPEDVDVDREGRIVGACVDGAIRRFRPGEVPEVLAWTGGRPLGLAWDREGRLLVADARRGLLRIDEAGGVEVLATEAEGVPFGFTDDVDVGPDGTVYFTDASTRHGIDDYVVDLLEHEPSGRLLAWRPDTRRTDVLLDGLAFPNGVAVSGDGALLILVETGNYRVLSVSLEGRYRGEARVLIDGLPGFPDGVSHGNGDVFWVAVASPRKPIIDLLAPIPGLRGIVGLLPRPLWPRPGHRAMVLGIDSAGRVLSNLQDPSPEAYAPVTSVEEKDGMLYLGSLQANGVGRIPVPWGRTIPLTR